MLIKIKTLVLGVSLFLNAAFIVMLIIGSVFSVSSISFSSVQDDNYITAAAIVSFPEDGSAVFNAVEILISPNEEAFLQFSVHKNNNQSNLHINTLYDTSVISVTHTGFGIKILALSEGSTLMQSFTNEGINDIALITVKTK